jgi:hypothetical protein
MKPYSKQGPAHSDSSHGRSRAVLRQAGVFAVEFSMVVVMFLLLIFILLEVSRALYIWNTLQEVTRRAARAAAATDFSDASALAQLRRQAIFRATPGMLAFSAPVSEDHVVIDYLALENQSDGSMTQVPIPTGSLPGCPARNRLVCTADAGSSGCIRFVRVRICQPGSNCAPVPYETIVPMVNMSVTLPISTTIVKAESLGYSPGSAMCN